MPDSVEGVAVADATEGVKVAGDAADEVEQGIHGVSDQATPRKLPSNAAMAEQLSELKGQRPPDADGTYCDEGKLLCPGEGAGKKRGKPKKTSEESLRTARKKSRTDAGEVGSTLARSAEPSNAEKPHSIFDVEALAKVHGDLEDISAEGVEQFPHALKSFEQWLLKGPLKKSAHNYMKMVCMLARSHKKSIAAMQDKRYYRWVLASCENRARNNMISAALHNFQKFISVRGGHVEGPWEEAALVGEAQYRVNRPARTREHTATKPQRSNISAAEQKSEDTGAKLKFCGQQQLKFFGRQRAPQGGGGSTCLSQEQLKRIEESRRAALLRRQALWLSRRQQLSCEEIVREAAETRVANAPKKMQLSAEQILRIEASRNEALRKRQQRLQQMQVI